MSSRVRMLVVLGADKLGAQARAGVARPRESSGGPVSLYPQIALRDTGTDSNVYNDSHAPKDRT